MGALLSRSSQGLGESLPKGFCKLLVRGCLICQRKAAPKAKRLLYLQADSTLRFMGLSNDFSDWAYNPTYSDPT